MRASITGAITITLLVVACGRTRGEPPPPSPRPDAAPPYTGYPRVSAGVALSCSVNADGQVDCWGRDAEKYSLGNTERVLDIDVSGSKACGILRDHTLLCWPGERGRWATPLNWPDGTFRKVAVGFGAACGLRTDGTLGCWGSPEEGITDPPEGPFLDVDMGPSHACALRANRTLVCWGWNLHGATDAPEGEFASVSSGGGNCALSEAGIVSCWGGAGKSFVGRHVRMINVGDFITCLINDQRELECEWGHVSPTPLPPGPFEQIDLGDYHGCGVRTDGSIACWGLNDNGQTSYGESAPRQH